MPRKTPRRPPRKPPSNENEPDKTFTLVRDPVTRAPIFSPHPWTGHDIHPNPVHANAPKETIVAMARKHTVEAVLTLVYHMRNAHDPELSMKAAELLLERGWGKTPQVIGLVGDQASDGKTPLSVEERRRILMGQVAPELTQLADQVAQAKPVGPAAPPSDVLD